LLKVVWIVVLIELWFHFVESKRLVSANGFYKIPASFITKFNEAMPVFNGSLGYAFKM